jgi:hypothetical protein
MDPDYSESMGAGNLSVNGLGRLGESGRVVLPLLSSSSASLNSSSWSASPSSAVPVDRLVGHPGLGEAIGSTGSAHVFPTIGEAHHSSPQAVPNAILDGLRSLNRTVEELYHRIHHQDPPSVLPPPPSPQPPVINIFTQGPGISQALPSTEDPVLAGGIAAAVLIILFVIGALLLRRFSPDRWKRVRDALLRCLRTAAVPFSWVLHRLGDLVHGFGSSGDGVGSVSTNFNNFSLELF